MGGLGRSGPRGAGALFWCRWGSSQICEASTSVGCLGGRSENFYVDRDHAVCRSLDRQGFTENDLYRQISTKNVFSYKFLTKFSRNEQSIFHASKQTIFYASKRTIFHASKQTIFHASKRTIFHASKRSGLIEILLFKREKAVSMTKRTRGWFDFRP